MDVTEYHHSTISVLKMSLLGLLVAATVTMPATAQNLVFAPDLEQIGWRVHTPRGKQAADFTIDGDGSLDVAAVQAVSFLYRPIPKTDKSPRVLSWQWRVDEGFPGTNLSAPGRDDRALAVHVYFSDQNAGVMRRLTRGVASMFGAPVSGRAITYVWGGQRPVGTVVANPFMDDGEGVLVIKRSSTEVTKQWVAETIDLVADYRIAFGEQAPPVRYIAVSADTDDTGATSRARIKDLRLSDSPTSLY